MALKISIDRGTADAVDGVGLDVTSGPGIGVDVGKDGDVKVGIKSRPPIQIELKARRTLDGNILITDHESIDIVLMPEKNKCMAFAKNVIHEDVYGAQHRLGDFLSKKGIIQKASIKSGNVFGSMEYSILESKIPGVDNNQACIYTIYRYIQEEKPFFEISSRYEDEAGDHLLQPEDEFSTELGEVPHIADKGSVDSRVRPFGYQYNYSIVRENKED